jgi:hypothetical protein
MYNANMNHILAKIPPHSKVIKAITGSSFGLPLEDVLLTFRATVEPIMGYGVALWMPIVSKVWLDRLQCVQKNALRTITGPSAPLVQDFASQTSPRIASHPVSCKHHEA